MQLGGGQGRDHAEAIAESPRRKRRSAPAEPSACGYCSLMAEIASLGEPVREGDPARWAEARAIFEQELEASERPSWIRRDA